MCGLAGVIAIAEGAIPDREVLRRVRDHMRARGPDGAGEWWSEDGRVGLAHRRLAIIDLSERGLQPMHEGPLSIVFNGEIYTYRALRAELEADGERFASDSDTEVLLKLYRRDGVGLFDRIRGMYAFAIWDATRDEVLLARDPFGIKPLYYARHGGQVWFASQARALVDTGAVPATPDLRGWTQFLLWGSVPEPRTAYESVKAVPAGSWVRIRPGRGVTVPVADKPPAVLNLTRENTLVQGAAELGTVNPSGLLGGLTSADAAIRSPGSFQSPSALKSIHASIRPVWLGSTSRTPAAPGISAWKVTPSSSSSASLSSPVACASGLPSLSPSTVRPRKTIGWSTCRAPLRAFKVGKGKSGASP